MPESVLVRFIGELQPGVTLRDVVNAIPYVAMQKGLLTNDKQNKLNVFSGRIMEIEGLPDLKVEQAFELTDATAERSCAGSTIKLSEATVTEYIRSNVALLKNMVARGYTDARTMLRRVAQMEAWLAHPVLMSADADAEYAEIIEIDLNSITEPIVAAPNDPDNIKLLSEVAGATIDEVFVGSCMTNIGHYRATAKVLDGEPAVTTQLWICPPTRMDESQLKAEGMYAIFDAAGARTEMPGCSLCMGNQARTADIGTVVTQSTPGTAHGISPFIVIDGQQRLTTITLLLAVVRNLFKIDGDENSADEINQSYLVNKFKRDDDFYKVLPTQRDRNIYKGIINNEDAKPENKEDENSSNIMQAFIFFTKQINIAIKDEEIELEKLKHVILDRLILVNITSDDRDNPYLIFESLNNKGLDLTQSDLIRNYVLMQFPALDRETIYKDSWLPLEQKFKDNSQDSGKELEVLTQFFWFYLRKDGNSITEKEIYKHMRIKFDKSSNKDEKLKELNGIENCFNGKD